MPITLGARFWSKVDRRKTDECWRWTASTTGNGYGQFWMDGKLHLAHRLSYQSVGKDIPDGRHIDHVCHTRLCVNPKHLRVVTNAQNHQNRSIASSRSASGVRGVWWNAKAKKWEAGAKLHGKKQFLGYYSTVREAELVVTEWRSAHMPFAN